MNRYPESMNPSLPKLSEAAKLDLCCGPTARPGSPGLAESAQAFTRIELLALLAGLVFVAMIALPVLANTNPGSQRLTCANNLRQIGQAFLMWANDHEERIPPMVPTNEGGTQLMPLGLNGWVQFSWISNELGTAKVLACPSDDGKVARDFSSDPSGGLLHPTFRNSAISYFVGHPLPEFPRNMLCGDRNLATSGPNLSCPYFLRADLVVVRPFTGRWTSSTHINSGNLLARDGHVEQLSDAGLNRYLNQPVLEGQGAPHLLMPR